MYISTDWSDDNLFGIFSEGQRIIDIKTTKEMINESLSIKSQYQSKLISTDSQSDVNKLKSRPKGIIISDTINHPIFPIPLPIVDTAKFDLPQVQSHYSELYGSKSQMYLPWHFVVEFIRDRYYVFNTRPIDMAFPLSTYDWETIINDRNIKVNEKTLKFFESKPFNMDQAIHILIIGDSKIDLYTGQLYEMIGRNCIGPILRYFKLPNKMWQKVWAINMYGNFKSSLLDFYLAR